MRGKTMLKNYILIQYDEEGREIELDEESGKKRLKFFSITYAVKSLAIATSLPEGRTYCAKLYRRRRAGGYHWIATYFRGGAHLTTWGQ